MTHNVGGMFCLRAPTSGIAGAVFPSRFTTKFTGILQFYLFIHRDKGVTQIPEAIVTGRDKQIIYTDMF